VVFVTARAQWSGLTMVDMKVNGSTILLPEKENSFIPMATNMMENGLIIKLTDKVFTLILKAHAMKDNGKMTNNMVRDWRPGRKALNTMAIM
jgi:hypothetical protein